MGRVKSIVLVVCFLSFFVMAGFVGHRASSYTGKEKETICVVSPYSSAIKEAVDKYTKEGYEVTHLVSQSISTSVSTGSAEPLNKQRDVKGDIILVMQKQ